MEDKKFQHPEGKIQLLNGRVLDCCPLEQPQDEVDTQLSLDTTGVYLSLKKPNKTNKMNNIGEWKGQNNIGKILMICRDCLIHGTEPEIDYELLTRANIYILGERLFA